MTENVGAFSSQMPIPVQPARFRMCSPTWQGEGVEVMIFAAPVRHGIV